MPPRDTLNEAVRVLTPYRQGDLDALCGLYAIINAVQLAVYPRRLTRAERRALFARGLDLLDSRGALFDSATDGMALRPWHRLCRAMIEAGGELAGEQLQLILPRPRQIRTTDDALRSITHHLRRGRPVLLEVAGRLDHWTVVVSISDARLTLFDSSGHRWLLLRSIGLIRGRAAPTHGIFATGIVAVRRLSRERAERLQRTPVDTVREPP